MPVFLHPMERINTSCFKVFRVFGVFFFSFNACKCSFRAAAGAGSESEAADVANEHMLTINIDIVLKGAPCALTCLCRFGSRIQTTSKTSTTVMLWSAINFFSFHFCLFCNSILFSLSLSIRCGSPRLFRK